MTKEFDAYTRQSYATGPCDHGHLALGPSHHTTLLLYSEKGPRPNDCGHRGMWLYAYQQKYIKYIFLLSVECCLTAQVAIHENWSQALESNCTIALFYTRLTSKLGNGSLIYTFSPSAPIAYDSTVRLTRVVTYGMMWWTHNNKVNNNNFS